MRTRGRQFLLGVAAGLAAQALAAFVRWLREPAVRARAAGGEWPAAPAARN
jgi:hypothetical protein